jgi:hypothetical protein
MYLANRLSTDFESIFMNQINSMTKASSAAIAGIDGFNVKDADVGVNRQDTGGQVVRSPDDNGIVSAYE